jgi:hypothetical protein
MSTMRCALSQPDMTRISPAVSPPAIVLPSPIANEVRVSRASYRSRCALRTISISISTSATKAGTA